MNKAKIVILAAWLLYAGLTAATLSAQEIKADKALKKEQQLHQEKQTNIKELTIRNSGFRSRSTVVIRYRDEDKAIVEIIENGESLPVSEFARYEAVMQRILELPEIDRLIPEIDRATRLAESRRIPEERVFREMMSLRSRLKDMNSEVARRYRDVTELQAMASMSRMAEQISESEELSPEEKIEKLKDLIKRSGELAVNEERRARQTRFPQFAASQAASKLIEEIEQADQMSQERKLRELEEVLRRTREMNFVREDERRAGLLEFKVAETLRKMLSEIAERDDLSEQDKEMKMQSLIEESRLLNLKTGDLMIGVEKFSYDLHRFLDAEGLLPKGKAEFVIKRNSSTIDGKKLPQEIHEHILKICMETTGKKFKSDTKIVMQLNEKERTSKK